MIFVTYSLSYTVVGLSCVAAAGAKQELYRPFSTAESQSPSLMSWQAARLEPTTCSVQYVHQVEVIKDRWVLRPPIANAVLFTPVFKVLLISCHCVRYMYCMPRWTTKSFFLFLCGTERVLTYVVYTRIQLSAHIFLATMQSIIQYSEFRLRRRFLRLFG